MYFTPTTRRNPFSIATCSSGICASINTFSSLPEILMRVLVLAAFALAACNDDNDRLASLESNTGDLTAIRAELAALRAEVGAMPVMPDVKPLADRLTALEAQVAKLSEARKVPHLVSRDTGVDYGVSVDGALAGRWRGRDLRAHSSWHVRHRL
jgi:hypothetical protein